jgi:hypothetical protein
MKMETKLETIKKKARRRARRKAKSRQNSFRKGGKAKSDTNFERSDNLRSITNVFII